MLQSCRGTRKWENSHLRTVRQIFVSGQAVATDSSLNKLHLGGGFSKGNL